MNRFLITSLSVLVSVIITGQSNLKPGYIIDNNNDTIYGQVANNEYRINSAKCEFIPENEENIKTYYPGDIYSYRIIDGKYYVTKSIEGKKYFVEYLVNGKMDLFFLCDESNSERYFITKDDALEELIYKEEYLKIDGKQYIKRSEYYKGTIGNATRDCPEIQQYMPKSAELNHKYLIDFTKKYHDYTCDDEICIIYEKKTPKKIKLDVFGGYGRVFEYNDESSDIHVPSTMYEDEDPFGFNVPSAGFNVLFQYAQRSENMYIGIGYNYEGNNKYLNRVPLSFNYINDNPGLSALFSFELDLLRLSAHQAFKAGLVYNFKPCSFYIAADLKTYYFITPYCAHVKGGLIFNLR